jgi:hypothetical protein
MWVFWRDFAAGRLCREVGASGPAKRISAVNRIRRGGGRNSPCLHHPDATIRRDRLRGSSRPCGLTFDTELGRPTRDTTGSLVGRLDRAPTGTWHPIAAQTQWFQHRRPPTEDGSKRNRANVAARLDTARRDPRSPATVTPVGRRWSRSRRPTTVHRGPLGGTPNTDPLLLVLFGGVARSNVRRVERVDRLNSLWGPPWTKS